MSQSSKDREDHVCHRHAGGKRGIFIIKKIVVGSIQVQGMQEWRNKEVFGVEMPSCLAHAVRDKGSQ